MMNKNGLVDKIILKSIYIYIDSSYKNRKQLMTLPCLLLIFRLYFLLFLFVPISRHTLDVLLKLPYRGSGRLGRRLEMG